MEQYIPKALIVAEIEKRKTFNETLNAHSRLDECNAILSFIDTLEVKEVDLEKELNDYGYHYDYVSLADRKELVKLAKHFFELGIKAKKGK